MRRVPLGCVLIIFTFAAGLASAEEKSSLIPPPQSTRESRKADVQACMSQASADASFGKPLDEDAMLLLQGHTTERFIRNGRAVVDGNYVPRPWQGLTLYVGPESFSRRYVVCLLKRGYIWPGNSKNSAESLPALPPHGTESTPKSNAQSAPAAVASEKPVAIDSPPAPKSPDQPETTRIKIGLGPQGIAFTPGAVWVAYGDDREFGVARIDANTNRVVARIPTGRWPVGATAGEGSVWIANRDDNSVVRVDPESNHVLATIRVGKKPMGVDAGEGAVWAANTGDGTVSRIDPRTNSVSATIHVGKQPSGVSVSNGAVWIANFGGRLTRGGTLVRLDAKTNAVTQTVKVSFANTVFAQGDDVWVTSQYEGAVLRVDGKTGAIVARIAIGGQPGGVTVSGGFLWVVDNAGAALSKVDIHSNSVVGKLEVGNGPIIFGRGIDPDGAIWISNANDGTVMKVKP